MRAFGIAIKIRTDWLLLCSNSFCWNEKKKACKHICIAYQLKHLIHHEKPASNPVVAGFVERAKTVAADSIQHHLNQHKIDEMVICFVYFFVFSSLHKLL